MKIFLTYASEDKNIAEQVYFALAGNNHTVFFDRASLPAGADYNAQIRQAIVDSDLLVFLISEASVAPSSYALTELAFAQNKWPHPAEVVVPVMVRPTDYERIPNYLKAVTIFEPRGNVAAEVAHEIAGIAGRSTRRARIVRALSKHWQGPVALGAAALVLVVALLGDGRINDSDGSGNQVSRELEEMKAKLQAMETESAMIKADYRALMVSFSRLQQGQKEELSAELESELATRFEDLSDEPTDVVASYQSDIEAVMRDPLLSSEQKSARTIDLIGSALNQLDVDIDRQARLIDSSPSPVSLDVETMKLKRLIDKRSQMFDMLRQIIDKYNRTAQDIIDSMGR